MVGMDVCTLDWPFEQTTNMRAQSELSDADQALVEKKGGVVWHGGKPKKLLSTNPLRGKESRLMGSIA